jgi:4-amino-4-deoxy-L-arabinose transferase-like glycosyltransferase
MPAESVTFSTFFRDRLAWTILAVSLLVRLILSASVGPGFDEAYYHVFARNLDWGYFDHPPAVAIIAGLGTWLTGLWTPLSLRLGAVLLFTLTLPGFYLLAGRLYNRDAARFALILPHAAPYFLVGAGAFVLPDNALMFAWVWALYVALRLREDSVSRTAGFLLLGALTGLALLAKYHGILLPASLVIASIYDKEIRRWWLDWRLYFALIMAVLVFAPTIWWNSNNEWISFAEQFGKGTSGEFRLRFDLMGQAIGGQVGYLTPWVAVALFMGVFRKRVFPHTSQSDRWLVAFFLTPVIGMTLIGLTRGILPHWTMPGYVAAFVLTAGGFAWTARVQRNTMIAVGINVLLVIAVIVQASTGFIPLEPKADPTLDPAGWSAAIDELEQSGDLRDNDIIFAHKWFTAGELAWADQERHEIVVLNQYDPHMFAWWAPEPWYENYSGVFITQARYNIDPDKHFAPRFANVEALPLDSVRHRSRWVRMKAWRLTDLQNPVSPAYGPFVAP